MKQKVFEIKSGIPVISRGSGLRKPKKVKSKKVRKDHPYVATLKAMKPGQCFDVPCANPTSIKKRYGFYQSHLYYLSNPVYSNIRYHANKFLEDMGMKNTHRVVIRGILNDKCYRVWLKTR